MINRIALAAVIALGTAGIASAAPQIVGGGGDLAIVYTTPSQNVVGAAHAQIIGGGDNRGFASQAVQAQPGRDVRIQGGGNDRRFVTGSVERPVILAQSLTRSQG